MKSISIEMLKERMLKARCLNCAEGRMKKTKYDLRDMAGGNVTIRS